MPIVVSKKPDKTLDYMISTIPVNYDVAAYASLVKPYGNYTQVGMPAKGEVTINNFAFNSSRVKYSTSLFGGIPQTQEVIDYCAENKIYPVIEIIKAEQINKAYEQVLNKEARYRYVMTQQRYKIKMKLNTVSGPSFCLNDLCSLATEILTYYRKMALLVMAGLLTLFSYGGAFAQGEGQMVRLAKLVIDPAQLESYKAALKEEIETSVRLEPGVLTLYAVSEKENPTHITILEIYADTAAYQAHIQTPHFLKYKNGTKDMVKSLELVETVPIVPGMKIK
jgi:4-carboxymuconolactone decarboxylase